MNIDDSKNSLTQDNFLIDADVSKTIVHSTKPKAKDYDKLSKALRHNLIKRKSQQRSRENPLEE